LALTQPPTDLSLVAPGPEPTLVLHAANGDKEPKVSNAAIWMNVGFFDATPKAPNHTEL